MGISGCYFYCSLKKKTDICADGVCSCEILTEKKNQLFFIYSNLFEIEFLLSNRINYNLLYLLGFIRLFYIIFNPKKNIK
jgi:hypothetical protein